MDHCLFPWVRSFAFSTQPITSKLHELVLCPTLPPNCLIVAHICKSLFVLPFLHLQIDSCEAIVLVVNCFCQHKLKKEPIVLIFLLRLRLHLETDYKASLFYYLVYFCYYSWVSLHFLVLFISLNVLFQLTFTFIYSTFSKKFSVSVK